MATYNPYGPVQVEINAAEPAGATTLEQAAMPVEAGATAAPVRGMSLQQIDAELARLGAAPPPAPQSGQPQSRLQQIDAELARLGAAPGSAPSGWDQTLGEIHTLPETPHVDVGTEVPPRAPQPAPNSYMPQDAGIEPAYGPVELARDAYTFGQGGAMGSAAVPWLSRMAPAVGRAAPGMLQRLGQGVGMELTHKAQQLTQPVERLAEQGLGWLTNRPAAGGPDVGSPTEVGLPDVLNVVAPEVLHRMLNVPRTVLGYTRAGRAITAAEETNRQAMEKYLQEFQAQGDTWKTKITDMSFQHQDELATLEAKAQQATEKALRAYHQEGQQTYDAALSDAYQASRKYQDAMRAYSEAEQGQAAGVLRAQRLADPSGRYGPDVPSRVLYGKLKDVAGEAPTSSAPAKDVVRDIAQEMAETGNVIPSSELAEIIRTINALPDTTDVAHLHVLLKRLSPMTGVRHGATRGMAQRLMSGVHDSIEAGAKAGTVTGEASELLYAARRAYHNEKSLETLQEILDVYSKESPITIDREGRTVVNPHTLLLRIESKLHKTSGPDRLFRTGFDAEQLVALRKELGDMLKIQEIPGTRPVPPDAAPLPGLAPLRPPPEPVTPDYQRGPTYPPPPPWAPPAPSEPTMQAPNVLSMLRSLGYGAFTAMATGHGGKTLAAGGTFGGLNMLEYGLSKILLAPQTRGWMLRQLSSSSTLSPEVLGVLETVGQAALASRTGESTAPESRRR